MIEHVIHSDGTEYWYKDGKNHRIDGPAVIYSDGSEDWQKDGKFYDAIDSDGRERWFKDDKILSGSIEIFYEVTDIHEKTDAL